MMLVGGQQSQEEASTRPLCSVPEDSSGSGEASRPSCVRTLVAAAPVGRQVDPAIPTIAGCTLCQRSVTVNPEASASRESGARPGRGPLPAPECPFLAHPSNQRRLAAVTARFDGSDEEETCRWMLSWWYDSARPVTGGRSFGPDGW